MDVVEADVTFASLHLPDVAPVELCAMRQFFLAQSCRQTHITNASAKRRSLFELLWRC